MTFTISSVCAIIAAILFILAAIPPTAAFHGQIVAIGLAFLALGHLGL